MATAAHPLYVGPTRARREEWTTALGYRDRALTERLLRDEPPGVSHFEILTFLNGLYRKLPFIPQDLIGYAHELDDLLMPVRASLGWRQRDLDLGLMRWMRRASALSAVLGAGVTMDAGGPSWVVLVRRLLEGALDRGHEVAELRHTPESTPEHVHMERHVVEVQRFTPAQEAEARQVLAAIEAGQADTDTLMHGAQLCYDLYGQHLFAEITQILYEGDRQPGPIHRAVAALAHPQHVPDRGPGPFAGWNGLISYNFDDLMGEALDDEGLARVAWAMRGDEMAGDPNEQAKQAGQQGLYQNLFHLHGYTPRRFFLITHVRFVFSTAQYLSVYGSQRSSLIDRAFHELLAQPICHALYIGCSFLDEVMNDLLRDAAQRFPARPHFALLRWEGARPYEQSSPDEITTAAARYRAMGVQPVWFDAFDEIPNLIRSLA